MTEPDHVVVDGVLQRTSPSGIQKFHACERKFYYRYVERLEDPAGAGALRGKEGHERVAHYLNTGQNVLDPLERAGLEAGLIPRFESTALGGGRLKLLIEQKAQGDPSKEQKFFRLPTRFGVPLIGAIDLIDATDPGRWLLNDWKFKKSIEMYGAKPPELIDPTAEAGIQMLTYAAEIASDKELHALLGPPPLELEVRHTIFQTKGRREVVKVSNTVPLDFAVDRWHRGVESVIPRMQEVAAKKSAFEVLGNEKHCGAYGGCPYISKCYDPMERIKATLKGIDTGETLKGLTAKKEGMTMGLLGGKAVTVTHAPIVEPGAPIVIASANPVAPSTGSTTLAPSPLAPDQPVLEKPGTLPISTAPQAAGDAVDVVGEEPIEAPKKRGPKPKALAAAPSAPVATAAPAPDATPGSAHGVGGGVRIFYDCQPVGVAAKSLIPIVQKLQDQVIAAAKLPVDDLRMCNDNQFGFNKWKAYLASHAVDSLKGKIKGNEIPAGDYLVIGVDDRVYCVAEAIGANLPAGCVVMPIGRMR